MKGKGADGVAFFGADRLSVIFMPISVTFIDHLFNTRVIDK
jgi:hypothetical protein